MLISCLPTICLGQPMQMVAGCHCFKDRSFDPARKFAADEYILATSFNSMLASFFNISKRQIIMLRMQGGVDGADLTTSLYIGKQLDMDFQKILSLRSGGQGWLQIIDEVNVKKSDPALNAISSNPDVPAAAAAMLVSRYFSVPSEGVGKYRERGLSDKEIVLVLGLSARSGETADVLADLYSEKGKSWGEIASSLGITAGDVGAMIASLFQTATDSPKE
ncbi:MAG: hypothetical protein H8E41_03175 [Desulfobulbaceae bacterium]|uniref:Uncharacterized protein n=1 Tax=Candidatus Desulfobia pelagia TaxID=2841692 RepID=A0A8J6TEW0_9BACT|nr:hypothetical protein [Candidatus Desulfobia pelagia]